MVDLETQVQYLKNILGFIEQYKIAKGKSSREMYNEFCSNSSIDYNLFHVAYEHSSDEEKALEEMLKYVTKQSESTATSDQDNNNSEKKPPFYFGNESTGKNSNQAHGNNKTNHKDSARLNEKIDKISHTVKKLFESFQTEPKTSANETEKQTDRNQIESLKHQISVHEKTINDLISRIEILENRLTTLL